MDTGKTGTLKLVVEAGSALAVLLGLVFVGLELRQNTAAVEAATFQAITDASSESLLTRASSDELTRIWLKAMSDFDGLTELERLRFGYINREFWVRMQNAYSQLQRGTLTEEDWRLYSAVICEGTAPLPVRENFENHRIIVSPGLQAIVDQCFETPAPE